MDKLDKLFKKVIEQKHEPYDPSAWESLSKRLDAGIPQNSNPFKKWGLPGAALVIGISIATWYFISTNSPVSSPVASSPNNTQIENKQQPRINDQVVPKQLPKKKDQVVFNTETNEVPTKGNDLVIIDNIVGQNNVEEPVKLIAVDGSKPRNEEIESTKPVKIAGYNSIALPLCEDQYSEVKNTNSFDVTISGENFSETILSNSSKKIVLKSGNYELLHAENNMSLQTHIVTGPKGEIAIDELVYENGLPIQSIHIKSDNSVRSMTFDNRTFDSPGKDYNINPFEKGTFSLSVKLSDERGCVNEISSILNVNDDYNLLAVNAFEPNSQDARKRSFIPFALTQRSTPFRMIILDPNDGGLVFETSDANQAWDGIDKRNGQMADANKAYVWKVMLSQPRFGEKSEYMGTIVRM